jgi:Zn-dependent membrane protease YugP
MFFDPLYFVFIAPAVLLSLWAQWRIHATYAQAQQMQAPLSGAAAARHILDSAGLNGVNIEPVPGHLSDHYDPRDKVLRLSSAVFNDRSLAAVGIAAHEAGHAIQDATHYAPLVIRNAAVPLAGFGSSFGIGMLVIGALLSVQGFAFGHLLVWAGILLFGAAVFFQVINLPVEFDASARAKRQLVEYGIVPQDEMRYVNQVLNAAALTYVAATLQAVLTLLYYIFRFTGGGRDE